MQKPASIFSALGITFLTVITSFPVMAQSFFFTTAQPGAVDGPGGTTTAFSDSDIVNFNGATSTGTIYLDDAVINDTTIPDMDALYILDNGNPIFSTKSSGAGFPFQDDLLVEYDITTDTLSVFFDFTGLITTGADADIDAFHLMPDGTFLISNISDYVLDSQSFEDGDIVHYDPVTATATLVLSEDLFSGDDDIRVTGVSVLDNGNLLLSAFNTDTGGDITLGGATFGRGDLVEYDLLTGVGSVFIDGSIFGGATEDFDGIHAGLPAVLIPIPGAIWLLLSGLGALGWLRGIHTRN